MECANQIMRPSIYRHAHVVHSPPSWLSTASFPLLPPSPTSPFLSTSWNSTMHCSSRVLMLLGQWQQLCQSSITAEVSRSPMQRSVSLSPKKTCTHSIIKGRSSSRSVPAGIRRRSSMVRLSARSNPKVSFGCRRERISTDGCEFSI
jgi:hypothetical protein